MDDLKTAKARLRQAALARRDAMGAAERVEASLAIAAELGKALSFDPGTVIAGFLPIRSEVDIRPLMTALDRRGARLCVPAITDGHLRFRQLVPGAALEPQGFGTSAPGPQAPVLIPAILLVPLAAFDRACHRIGYGRGFYDRAIAAIRRKGIVPLLAGVAFAVQEIDLVPTDAHDERLDVVATERGLIRPA